MYIICTGNTCRSPMAEAILRSKVNDKIAVRSAGIHAQNGTPIAPHAKKLIEEAGMPYTPFSRALSLEDIEWADVILTMTTSHKQALLYSFPKAEGKTFTLKGFVNPDTFEDVHDPYGGDLETYRYTFAELSSVIESIKEKLYK
ncbi:low molecular weight protein arginine phosphatase [Sporosarcina sp. G11-34]|uniref:low molecular weight protein arginine phosphatase n=1 Tax=Sporosarcina sp. G11-34 TaxID=2849605 RepID=UPI002E778042|nr:low molecular weight protein arginine phosphatase [Sporosarcina sp. G11-34]